MHMSEITIAYGMIETSPGEPRAAETIRSNCESRRLWLQPHLEVKIVDRHGRVLPRGRPVSCVRGDIP